MYPILLELGPIQIYTYGVFLALAFYFSVRWAVRSGGTLGIPEEKILNLAIVSILSAIVGARFTYVVVYWQKFQGGFLDVFKIWNGGLVFYGGLIGGVLGGVLYWWWKKENVLAMADCAAMAVSLGQGIGRIGCFFLRLLLWIACSSGASSGKIWNSVSCPGSDSSSYPGLFFAG